MDTKLATKRRRLVISPFIFAAVLAAAFGLCPIAQSAETVIPLFAFDSAAGQAGQSGQAPRYTGPGSCASTTCHGSVSPRTDNRVLQNEYSTWIVKDKHSKAYASWRGNLGGHMATILVISNATHAPLRPQRRSELRKLPRSGRGVARASH